MLLTRCCSGRCCIHTGCISPVHWTWLHQHISHPNSSVCCLLPCTGARIPKQAMWVKHFSAYIVCVLQKWRRNFILLNYFIVARATEKNQNSAHCLILDENKSANTCLISCTKHSVGCWHSPLSHHSPQMLNCKRFAVIEICCQNHDTFHNHVIASNTIAVL